MDKQTIIMSTPKTKRTSKTSHNELRLSTGTVQCADPDLKREALSELFDHCMTPIGDSQMLSSMMNDASNPGSQKRILLRARPLSAAPVLDIDISRSVLNEQPEKATSGLLSPMSPSHEYDTATFYSPTVEGSYFDFDEENQIGGADETEDDECGFECSDLPVLGTFADLRRKLYGGELHVVATADAV
ncbi:hypothetical protein COEREDRAFT_82229 [Coemansia reversa NRRL 1564]|uniref:Uncharacterized protein n=1 Tax=Coemansia reversa (strain ATCC 12441 / NRRL 1564) TaxID=763665 RepID=A0A2G5B8B8_COERN|nr:hypothetical protein COEREDRAFT_82229 [Coemansia reversa NRRL 1564]|eukprot:PIA15268.1 hypothetical protein COEREDRAFT_82229 [Coemansia reversa NRRL 1564]